MERDRAFCGRRTRAFSPGRSVRGGGLDPPMGVGKSSQGRDLVALICFEAGLSSAPGDLC